MCWTLANSIHSCDLLNSSLMHGAWRRFFSLNRTILSGPLVWWFWIRFIFLNSLFSCKFLRCFDARRFMPTLFLTVLNLVFLAHLSEASEFSSFLWIPRSLVFVCVFVCVLYVCFARVSFFVCLLTNKETTKSNRIWISFWSYPPHLEGEHRDILISFWTYPPRQDGENNKIWINFWSYPPH